MIDATRRHAWLRTVLLAAVVATGIAAGPAFAQDESAAPRLGIAPVGYDGSWFDLEMEAGESRNLSVELANHGEEQIDARTYAADVYTLVGGGMGVALADASASGTTEWVDYPTETLGLEPDEGERRTLTVSVPSDAEPGQYISALVIENEQPISGEGEVSVDRVVRQALAINITVPGPATPALEITEARHTDPGGRSVVLLGVDNTGNRHLHPTGQLTLTDSSGATVATEDVAMDIHFAGTATEVELALEELLAPGTYTLSADLRDDEHDIDAIGSAQFEVIAPPGEGSAIPGRDRLEGALRDAGLPAWVLPVAASLVLLALLLLIGLLVRLLLRRPTSESQLPNSPEPVIDQPPHGRPHDSAGHPAQDPAASPHQVAETEQRPVREPVDLTNFSARTAPKRVDQRKRGRGRRRRK